MTTTRERTQIDHADIAQDLTYAERKRLAAGDTGDIAPALLRRARRRLYLCIWVTLVHVYMAVALYNDTGPLSAPGWVQKPLAVAFGLVAPVMLILGVRAFRESRNQARLLEER